MWKLSLRWHWSENVIKTLHRGNRWKINNFIDACPAFFCGTPENPHKIILRDWFVSEPLNTPHRNVGKIQKHPINTMHAKVKRAFRNVRAFSRIEFHSKEIEWFLFLCRIISCKPIRMQSICKDNGNEKEKRTSNIRIEHTYCGRCATYLVLIEPQFPLAFEICVAFSCSYSAFFLADCMNEICINMNTIALHLIQSLLERICTGYCAMMHISIDRFFVVVVVVYCHSIHRLFISFSKWYISAVANHSIWWIQWFEH